MRRRSPRRGFERFLKECLRNDNEYYRTEGSLIRFDSASSFSRHPKHRQPKDARFAAVLTKVPEVEPGPWDR
jgi:hypothetical protein